MSRTLFRNVQVFNGTLPDLFPARCSSTGIGSPLSGSQVKVCHPLDARSSMEAAQL